MRSRTTSLCRSLPTARQKVGATCPPFRQLSTGPVHGLSVAARAQPGTHFPPGFAKLSSFTKNHLPWLFNMLDFANIICEMGATMATVLGYARVSTADQDLSG